MKDYPQFNNLLKWLDSEKLKQAKNKYNIITFPHIKNITNYQFRNTQLNILVGIINLILFGSNISYIENISKYAVFYTLGGYLGYNILKYYKLNTCLYEINKIIIEKDL